jgi:signal transduction histidine kinase
VKLAPVDARRLCLQAYEKWSPLLARVRVRLHVHLPDEAPKVLTDAAHFQRLLNILLENAGKYTPAGGKVFLEFEVKAGRARFSISDTGIGIPSTDLPHIFERFRRASNVQQADVSGSGLGLALAAWIARHHATWIEVESGPGAGSTFAFDLMVAREANSPAIESESSWTLQGELAG